MHEELIDINKRDQHGYYPDADLIGSRWKHYRRGQYRVELFMWCSERDRWTMLLMPLDDLGHIPCVTTPQSFFGTVRHPLTGAMARRFTRSETDGEIS